MEIWVLTFLNNDEVYYQIGVYTSFDLAVKAMKLDSKYNNFHNLENISKRMWNVPQACWCNEGRYGFINHNLNRMPIKPW